MVKIAGLPAPESSSHRKFRHDQKVTVNVLLSYNPVPSLPTGWQKRPRFTGNKQLRPAQAIEAIFPPQRKWQDQALRTARAGDGKSAWRITIQALFPQNKHIYFIFRHTMVVREGCRARSKAQDSGSCLAGVRAFKSPPSH